MNLHNLPRFPVQIQSVDLIGINATKLNDKPINEQSKKFEINVKNWIEIINESEVNTFLRITFTPQSDEVGLFKLDIVYRGKCKAMEDIPQEELEHFGEVQSIALLWPYIRQQITNTLTQMGLPPYILPTIDVLKSKASLKNDREKNV